MIPAVLIGPLQLPDLHTGPALVVPATVTWLGPTTATIGVANTAQQLAPSRSARKGWFIFNFSTVNLWIDDTNNPTVDGGICVGPGKEYCCPSNMVTAGELRIMGSAASAKFFFREAV